MPKNFLFIKDFTVKEIHEIFKLASDIKKNPSAYADVLKGKSIGLLFEKPSNRTRVSFEVGIFQMGAHAVYLRSDEVSVGVREGISDVSRTLSRYLDAVVIRTFGQDKLEAFARYSTVPVINALTDFAHPCQALADLFTIAEKKGKCEGLTLAFIGDGNNVCHSLLEGCALLGVHLNVATPKRFGPNASVVSEAQKFAQASRSKIRVSFDPRDAVSDADVVYTDVWASMGKEQERRKRIRKFRDFQINKELLSHSFKNPLIMHCLPAHRGEEITDEVIESKNSVIFDQAENRLYIQKAILIKLLGRK